MDEDAEPAAAGAPTPVDAADATLVATSLAALGLPPCAEPAVPLSAGGSGARVLLLGSGDRRVVLKVTADPAWRGQAVRELALYRADGPDRAAFRPGLLAATDDGAVVRLLLEATEPYPPATALSEDEWLAVATDLGRLHRLPVPRGPWPGPPGEIGPAELAAARRRWDRHGRAAVADRAARRLTGSPAAGPEPVLVHGDCHVGNLVRGPDGRPRWVDWQETRLGAGPEDLAFLWQRAEFDGARPPRAAMTSAYAEGRGRRPDPALCAALDAAELRLLLLAWPAFLPLGGEPGRRRLTERFEELAAGAEG